MLLLSILLLLLFFSQLLTTTFLLFLLRDHLMKMKSFACFCCPILCWSIICRALTYKWSLYNLHGISLYNNFYQFFAFVNLSFFKKMMKYNLLAYFLTYLYNNFYQFFAFVNLSFLKKMMKCNLLAYFLTYLLFQWSNIFLEM